MTLFGKYALAMCVPWLALLPSYSRVSLLESPSENHWEPYGFGTGLAIIREIIPKLSPAQAHLSGVCPSEMRLHQMNGQRCGRNSYRQANHHT